MMKKQLSGILYYKSKKHDGESAFIYLGKDLKIKNYFVYAKI